MFGKSSVDVERTVEVQEIFNQLSRRLGRDPTDVEVAAEKSARDLYPLYGSKGYVTR